MSQVVDLNDELFVFADESDSPQVQHETHQKPWKILVVDDEKEIHGITRMVLSDVTFESAPLELLSAYSGNEAIEILRNSNDIAVILLDVVMEHDEAGLETVRAIRKDLSNKTTRIVIRTGQPGIAPERSVIIEYDINDYREKTELTSQKLFTTVISALRNYRDMRDLQKSRDGMKRIVESSAPLFEHRTMYHFSESVLHQFTEIFEGTSLAECPSFIAHDTSNGLTVSAAKGRYTESLNKAVPSESIPAITQLLLEERSFFNENSYVGFCQSPKGERYIHYIGDLSSMDDLDRDLIKLFSNTVAVAYENYYLNTDIIDTQKEIILRMGDIVETRCKETANHVYRVAEYSYLLAKEYGLSEEEAQVLRDASPMHDVGKVGVPDSILLKPGKLTVDEFKTMCTHTTLGHSIFKNSPREIIQAASAIAHEHHERWDGKGYPRGLSGEEISIFGRITALADVFDALASKRSYKEPWSYENAFEYIEQESGKIFDPTLVKLFLNIKESLIEIRTRFPDHL